MKQLESAARLGISESVETGDFRAGGDSKEKEEP
jgi:hypothetical protein